MNRALCTPSGPALRLTGGHTYSELGRSVRVAVEVQVRRAMLADLASLATWSGNVDAVFRPAVESGRGVLLVASANGRFPIGHMLVDLRSREADGIAVLSHLQVLGGFRDQGIGGGLVDEGEGIARQAGLDKAQLAVEKVNTPAKRLYERHGYEVIGESVDRWPEPGPDGSLRDVDHPSWVMQKVLR